MVVVTFFPRKKVTKPAMQGRGPVEIEAIV
jgi:hypothetical protein